MHWIDQLIVILFLFSFSFFGIWQANKNKSSGDYFLAGKDLPWAVSMLSIVATETSVLTFISLPGLAYRGEWFFLQLGFGYIIGRILVSIFLLPAYFEDGIVSIYEVIGNKFGSLFQKIASFIFLVTRVLADGVRFLATAVVVQVITGWSIELAVFIIGLVTLVYTLSGGLRTVIWIDSIQFLLYIIGGLISIYFALDYLGIPFSNVITDLSSSNKMKIFNFNGNLLYDPYYFFSAVLGGVFLSFSSHGIDHMMVQRVLSTRNLASARKSMIASGVFVFIQFTIFLLAGSLIFLIAGDTAIQKDREFTYFIVNYLPVGLRGILLAGVLSAAMSTLSSSINSLASSTVMDWFKGREDVAFSRIISLVWGAVLISIALLFDESDSAVMIVGLQIASFTYGGLLGLFLLSKFENNFLPISLILGLTLSVVSVFILKEYGFAWTSFIFISVSINIFTTISVDKIIRFIHKSNF